MYFYPLGDPTGQTTHGKQGREHIDRETNGLVDDPRIEVDVGIQLSLYEVLVLDRNLFQFDGDFQVVGVDLAQDSEHERGLGDSVDFLRLDVGDDAIDLIRGETGKLDILVNAAGIEIEKTVEDTSLEE